MEQVVAFGPPPLPPKTRRSPPEPATVLSSNADVVFDAPCYSISNGIIQQRDPQSPKTPGSHVVKIHINPGEAVAGEIRCGTPSTGEVLPAGGSSPCIRINVNADSEMIQSVGLVDATPSERAFFYYSPFNCNAIMSSGQVSPSDTLDSGTCSDLDSAPPPPLPTKKTKAVGGSVSVTVIGAQHKRAPSLTSSGADADSDDNESNISCDSLNSGELPPPGEHNGPEVAADLKECKASAFLPQGLLQDIRERSVKLSQPNSRLGCQVDHDEPVDDDDGDNDDEAHISDAPRPNRPDEPKVIIVQECTYEERRRQQVPTQKQQQPAPKEEQPVRSNVTNNVAYESDKFINFHLNEKFPQRVEPVRKDSVYEEDESFAGFKDLLQSEGSSTIRSAKGTIRGVKNRVRAGIATFLNINDQTKTYKEKDAGKVVVYTTTMGIVRDTYQSCMKVKQILRTQLVRFEERDVFMSADYQAEIRDRMRCDFILVPQVFVDGQHIGDAETIERLNESGELRRILKPYKSMDACTTCQMCGGYNLLPCPVCNGSKKSVHRNHFTTEFVALKCMNCDEVGLVKCTSCAL